MTFCLIAPTGVQAETYIGYDQSVSGQWLVKKSPRKYAMYVAWGLRGVHSDGTPKTLGVLDRFPCTVRRKKRVKVIVCTAIIALQSIPHQNLTIDPFLRTARLQLHSEEPFDNTITWTATEDFDPTVFHMNDEGHVHVSVDAQVAAAGAGTIRNHDLTDSIEAFSIIEGYGLIHSDDTTSIWPEFTIRETFRLSSSIIEG